MSNPNHDPETGEFSSGASGAGGASVDKAVAKMGGAKGKFIMTPAAHPTKGSLTSDHVKDAKTNALVAHVDTFPGGVVRLYHGGKTTDHRSINTALRKISGA